MPIDTRHPREIRADIRSGKLSGITAGLGQNFAQANLAVLPKDHAYDFLLFCQRNPRPCPLIEVTDVGSPEPVGVAPGADLRTDIPRYRIYKDGVVADEVTDVTPYWRDDLVAFLLGCSFTFEWALLDAGIRLWHVEQGKNVAMWRTNVQCRPAGVFHGPMVVSMRPIASSQLSKAVTASARLPNAHGAPVHRGDPAEGPGRRHRDDAELQRAARLLRPGRHHVRSLVRHDHRDRRPGRHGRAATLANSGAALLLRRSRARLRSGGRRQAARAQPR